ncbi:MAG: HD domain-containing phosphohydrolase [Candidatus Woesearchaeota archaeon]
MENNSKTISVYKVVKSLSYSMDLISQTVVGHHKKVSYISLQLGKELNLKKEKLNKLVVSALIHDLGVFYLNQKYSDLSFDSKRNKHAEIGYNLLNRNFPIKEIPQIIRYHHHDWKNNNEDIPLLSNILHLADRIAVLIKDEPTILNQKNSIIKIIKRNTPQRFFQDGVQAFENLANKEYFWLDLISDSKIEKEIDNFFAPYKWKINFEELQKISYLISHIIDFRSSFTATHSEGIATISSLLSKYFNFTKKNQQKMKIAGYLHDIGKLIVPPDILNKKEKLNNKEWSLMKTHTYYTYQALSNSKKLDNIKKWASFHHEKLNGKGYPFHLTAENLSLGSRIMAVADIFTAITEDRPYRKGMPKEKVKGILNEMAEMKEIDKEVTTVIIDNFDEFNQIRKKSQLKVKKYFQNFNQKTKKIL